MQKKIPLILLTISMGFLVYSCNSNSTQTVDLDAIRTEAVSTYAFSLTETLAPQPTATFTLTSLPSFTPSAVTATMETTADSCYNLRWIKDVTIPDGTQMKANET